MTQQEGRGRMNGLVVGLMAGTAIGTALGILYAPKPGRETRAMIRGRYQGLRERANDMTADVRERAKEFAAAAKERFRPEEPEEFHGA